MGIEKKEIYKCDICGKVHPPTNGCPSGWQMFVIDDHYQDRCWHDKVICNICLDDLFKALKMLDKKNNPNCFKCPWNPWNKQLPGKV